jgi:hypothetical protein
MWGILKLKVKEIGKQVQNCHLVIHLFRISNYNQPSIIMFCYFVNQFLPPITLLFTNLTLILWRRISLWSSHLTTRIYIYKQPNSLKNLLVRAEISKPNTNIGKSYSCRDKRCKCCRHMQNPLLYTSKITGK